MNRKARRRAIYLLERRRLLQNGGGTNGAAEAEPFRFSLGYGAEPALGKRLREPLRELQLHSNR